MNKHWLKPIALRKNPFNIKDLMYAIVEINQAVEFDKVLLVDKDGSVQVGAPTVDGAKVVCEVVNPLVKGDKVIVFKMKRRKDYRKKNGHRSHFTEVTIKEVIA